MREEEFEVEEILDAKGDPAHWWYYVKWAGDWPGQQYSWSHTKDVLGCAEMPKEF
jgi:hypothetical protein